MLQPGGDQMLRAEVLTAQLRSGGAACVGYASGYSVVYCIFFIRFATQSVAGVLSVSVSTAAAPPRTQVVSYTLH